MSNEKLVEALNRIAALDPKEDSAEGFNEWGEADCFRQAQEIAREAIASLESNEPKQLIEPITEGWQRECLESIFGDEPITTLERDGPDYDGERHKLEVVLRRVGKEQP